MELKLMSEYISQKKINVIKELPSIFFVLSDEIVLIIAVVKKRLNKVKILLLEYRGYFLNDSLIDDPLHPMQFIYGTPDQLVEGLNFVIKGMCKGETKKIIYLRTWHSVRPAVPWSGTSFYPVAL